MNFLQRPDGDGRAIAAAVLAGVLACSTAWGQGGAAAPRVKDADKWNAVRAMTTWFECEECQDGELAAVVKYGPAIVPSLSAVLEGGLSPATRELLRRDLETRYDELLRHAERRPEAKPASTRNEFIALYLENFDTQYKVRAAIALAEIGGPQARASLDAALAKAVREDLRRTIRQAQERAR